jgi:H+-translocating NAD(P) transhydrogenase subunit alpha
MQVAVLKETAARENRVALTPESVARLVKAKVDVMVQRGAGERAGFPDQAYEAAGARLASDPASTVAGARVVLKVQAPTETEIAMLPSDSVLIALLRPGHDEGVPQRLADRRVSALALELVPRITRAQSMDVLSSQSTVAGYKAVLVGASYLGKFLPMLTTAAGNIQPARVFVIGAGVSGLQAIATARRLGAVVSAFDVRPAAREQILSLGASAIGVDKVAAAEGAGGYARAQTEEERQATLALITTHLRDVDLVITTANIPGRRAPLLITEEAIGGMRPGAVIVDLAAENGGNTALTKPDEVVQAGNVTIVGTLNLPSTVAYHASQMFGRNVLTLLQHLLKDGILTIDPADEITGAMLVAHDGRLQGVPQ